MLSDPTPTGSGDAGGDPACWLHLIDDAAPPLDPVEQVVDLGARRSGNGVVWSLSPGTDLDARLVRLLPGHGSGEHADDDADVLLLVRSGSGELTVDGSCYRLRSDVLALVPRGCRRAVAAGVQGLSYLSVRRAVDSRPTAPAAADIESRERTC